MAERSGDTPDAEATKVPDDHHQHEEVLIRVGQLTRSLHDSLRGLGFDKLIERAANDIPNARDRLDYVARMTEQAAQRVLNATDASMPLQEKIEAGAASLSEQWLAAKASSAQASDLDARIDNTIAFLSEARTASHDTRQHLMAIMMAQDFQDLTGQVIKKVTELAHDLEQQLVQLLIDYAPPEIRRDAGSGLLNGPQINPTGTSDVVADQGQVDDLLDSLGF